MSVFSAAAGSIVHPVLYCTTLGPSASSQTFCWAMSLTFYFQSSDSGDSIPIPPHRFSLCFLTLFQQPDAVSGTITHLENHTFNALYACLSPVSITNRVIRLYMDTSTTLDGPGIESRWGEILRLSRPALGPTQPPVQWVPGLSRG